MNLAAFIALVAIAMSPVVVQAQELRPHPVPVTSSSNACKVGRILTGTALGRTMLGQNKPFRATLPLANGGRPEEVVFSPSGDFRTTLGEQGGWELTDDEGLMMSGPGDKAAFWVIRRHEQTLWACSAEGIGPGYAIRPG